MALSRWQIIGILALIVFAPVGLLLGLLLFQVISGPAIATIVASLGIFLIFLLLSGFVIVIGMMVAPHNPSVGRVISYIGVLGAMFLLFILEISIIGVAAKSFIDKGGPFKFLTCENLGSSNIITAFSCAITGFTPVPQAFDKNNIWNFIGAYGFWFFGFLIPLGILGALFTDGVESSGMVQNTTYQKVIGWGLGFLAYRGFIVSKLIFLLDIGSVGMAVVGFNFLMMGILFSWVKRLFDAYKPIEQASNLVRSNEVIRNNVKGVLARCGRTGTSALTGAQINTEISGISNELQVLLGAGGLTAVADILSEPNDNRKRLKARTLNASL